MDMSSKQMTFQYFAFLVSVQLMQASSQIHSYSLEYFLLPVLLNGLEVEFPLLTSFPETLNGSRMEVFFIARNEF